MTPLGFETGTKTVDVGKMIVCAIDQFNDMSCWVLRNTGEYLFKQNITKNFDNPIKTKQVKVGFKVFCTIDLNE